MVISFRNVSSGGKEENLQCSRKKTDNDSEWEEEKSKPKFNPSLEIIPLTSLCFFTLTVLPEVWGRAEGGGENTGRNPGKVNCI